MFRRLPPWARRHLTGLRTLLVLTVLTGVLYPLAVMAVAQLPGLRHRADGSYLTANGRVVGSTLLGQAFVSRSGAPLPQYFQPRPSDAGSGAGYDPTASGGSNLGPENVVDTLPNPARKGATGTPSLLTQVCARSKAVGEFNGVNGRRPYCTATGVGAVLSVIPSPNGKPAQVVSANQECPAKPFIARYDGLAVQCARYGVDYAAIGRVVAIRGPGRPWPLNPVPPDAVTASASGLDPDISVAYAGLQAPRVARTRHLPVAEVRALVRRYTVDRTLGFMGQPVVNVLELNAALDRLRPAG